MDCGDELIRSEFDPLLDEMYQANYLPSEIFRRILYLEVKMIRSGLSRADSQILYKLKKNAATFLGDICALPAVSPPMPIGAGCPIWGYSPIALTASGLDSDDVLRDAGAIIVRSDDEILEERINILAGAIMYKYEAQDRDLARMLEVVENQKQAEVALKFGFDFELLGKDIHELRRELRRIVSTFSPSNTDVRRIMIMLASEPCLHGAAKLRWISEKISMLRRIVLDLDSEVKSRMLKMKSESYLSYLKKEESSIGKGVAGEATAFAAYRLCWERHWGNGYSFEDQNQAASQLMLLKGAPCRSTQSKSPSKTKQKSRGHWMFMEWSLPGTLDRQRNPLFIRTRNYCQVLTEDDPFLHLTGPVRAIVSMGTVYIETELKAKGRRRSEDVVLASTVINSDKGDDFYTSLADNKHCTIELCSEELKVSVQATIVSLVVKSKPGSAPFPYGGKILCSSLPSGGIGDSSGIPSRQALLFDSVDGKLVKDRAGHLDLNRRVLSVDLLGRLQFHIQRYSQPGSAEIDARVLPLLPERCNISKGECPLDDGSVVAITVAWSLIPSKMLTC